MKSQIEAAMHHDGGDEISANRMSSHDVVTPSKFSYCCRKKVSGHGHEELSDEEIAEVLRRTIAGDTASPDTADVFLAGTCAWWRLERIADTIAAIPVFCVRVWW
jgi:hypothetical protein